MYQIYFKTHLNIYEIALFTNANKIVKFITPEFALSELCERKLCVSGKTHANVVVLVVWVVFVWFGVCYV